MKLTDDQKDAVIMGLLLLRDLCLYAVPDDFLEDIERNEGLSLNLDRDQLTELADHMNRNIEK
jgi:hypothetical protein